MAESSSQIKFESGLAAMFREMKGDLSNDEFLRKVLEAYQVCGELTLSSADRRLVEEVCSETGKSMSETVSKALVAYAKRVKPVSKNTNFSEMTFQELMEFAKTSTAKGLAVAKIEKLVESIETYNLKVAVDDEDKVYLTPNLVFTITNTNRNTINKWFEDNAEIVERVRKDLTVEANTADRRSAKEKLGL